ncbi:Serine/threonine protein kinase [Pseudoalteromonas phenolica]|uniref:Serine/threonine protein kinase n=2 Tax=Pseudoalteromonas phenolica TaxID=161398 RepID=A0A0S2K651_9GAMM|nr:Serine/threonine protein kinase [Pseudoalteromonas phenolica]
MSRVFLAVDAKLERHVAVKVLDVNKVDKQQALNEAKILARVNHPNIVQVYKVHESDSQLAIEMEYVQGATLKHFLKTRHLESEQKLQLLIDIAQGLSEAHKNDILHLDLKADNILINAQGVAKIADFGIAQLGDEQRSHHSSFGSLTAMSPEQLNKQPLDQRADLFAFGLLAYQLFANEHPYLAQAKNAAPDAIAEQIKHVPCQSDASKLLDMPAQLGALINSLLAFDKAARPNSFHQVISQLKQLQQNIGYAQCDDTQDIDAVDLQVPTPSESITNAKPSFWQKYGAAMSFLFAVCLVSAGYWYWQTNQPKSYIAALPITFDGQTELTDTQQRIATLGLEDAISNFILQDTSSLQVSNSEVTSTLRLMGEQASQTDIGKALGADVLLESVFNCRNSLCEVTLNAIDAHTATLLDTTRYSVDTESFSEAYHNSLVNIEALFDKRFTSQTYSDAFYDKYVAQVEAFQSGSQDIAVTLAEVKSLIRQEPNFVPLYRFYRKVVVEEHRIQQNNNVIWDFLDALEQAPETYKNSHNYIIDRIQAYQTIKDWQKAEMLISELSILDIEKFELYSVKANFYREKFDYPKALKSITLAYKLKPTVQVVRNTAIIYLLNGNYEKANEHLKKLIDTAQFDFWALRTYADISLLNGNSQSAIDAYLKLLINNPRNANALSNIAIAYSLIGNFKNSHEYARKAYNINPSNLSIVLNFADSYSYLKHSSEAYKLYTQIIDLTAETNDIDELIIRAQALLHTGNKVEALQLITKIENETSNIHDLMFSKAMILTKLGEHQSALLLIESSIKDGWNKSFYGLPWFKDLCQYRLKFMQTIGANDFNSLCSNSIE